MKFASAILLLALIMAASAANAAPPTCANPIGTWKNQLQSILNVQSYDAATGAISGKYKSPSGGGGTDFPFVGWINTAPSSTATNSAIVVSFSVNWGQYGSITSWTGTCTNNQINGLWHLARTRTDFDWDHVLVGDDLFNPQ